LVTVCFKASQISFSPFHGGAGVVPNFGFPTSHTRFPSEQALENTEEDDEIVGIILKSEVSAHPGADGRQVVHGLFLRLDSKKSYSQSFRFTIPRRRLDLSDVSFETGNGNLKFFDRVKGSLEFRHPAGQRGPLGLQPLALFVKPLLLALVGCSRTNGTDDAAAWCGH
jgi:hypothetical protein